MKRKKSIWLRVVLAVLGVILVLAVLGGVKALQFRTMMAAGESMSPPPEVVTTAKVRAETWRPTIATVGSIAAVQGVMVRAEMGGTVEKIAFESGRQVEKGDLLLQLEIATEEAQLRAAEVDAGLASDELKRARDLSKRRVIAASELDTATARAQSAAAQVENLQSAIAKKTIRAPFAGRLGIRQVNLGQVLDAGAEVVSLQTVEEVFADFSVPQQRISDLEVGMEVRVTTDAYPGKTFPGTLTALNSSLDEMTRSLPLQATLENPGGLLRAGMFARVEIVLPQEKSALIIPATAVAYAPYGDSVYVVETPKDEESGPAGPKLRQAFVRLGDARGDFVEVTKGVEAGQEVASSGLFKLRNGMAVKVDNKLAPTASLDPHPPET